MKIKSTNLIYQPETYHIAYAQTEPLIFLSLSLQYILMEYLKIYQHSTISDYLNIVQTDKVYIYKSALIIH